MGILTIITGFLPVLLSLLSSSGVLSASTAGLIQKLSAAVPTLVAALFAGGGATADVLAVLQAIQTEVEILRSSNAVFTLNQANEIAALDAGIIAAIKAFNAAKLVDDPSNLTPLPTSL